MNQSDMMTVSCYLPRMKSQDIKFEDKIYQEDQEQVKEKTYNTNQVPRIIQSVMTGRLKTQGDSNDIEDDYTLSQVDQSNFDKQYEESINYQKIGKSIFSKFQQLDEDQFITKLNEAEVQFCISSPLTRQLFANTVKVQQRQTLTLNIKKIWLENQSECFHCMFETKALRILLKCESSKIPREELLRQFHSKDLKDFVIIFCKLPEVRESIFGSNSLQQVNIDPTGINLSYSEVIAALQEYMKSCFQNENNSQLIEDQSERYLTRLIYDRLFPSQPTARDIELNMKLKTIEWITDEHLSIKLKKKISTEEIFHEAVKQFQDMDQQKNAVDKLECLLNATKRISEIISQINEEPSSADTVFPIFIRVLILAQPTRLQSNINFIELFVNKSRMMSESGYSFTQLKSAVVWIENLDHHQLKMDEKQFHRFVYEKNVKYGLCRHRPRKERVLLF